MFYVSMVGVAMLGIANGSGKWHRLQDRPSSSASPAWMGKGSVPANACAVGLEETLADMARGFSGFVGNVVD